jgi:hypothetical protein
MLFWTLKHTVLTAKNIETRTIIGLQCHYTSLGSCRNMLFWTQKHAVLDAKAYCSRH